MGNPKSCPECGAPLSADVPLGMCPECLLRGGMAAEVRQSTAAYSGGKPANGASFVAPTIEEIAQHFPQLHILEPLGQGGMGAVYKVRQKSLDRVVALKILSPDAAKDPAFAERFSREARAMAKLMHPNIVLVFEFGEVDGLYYLIMEHVEGVNLRQAMRARSLSSEQALAVVPQICDALEYAHEEGIVHRDIKPENVLLDKKGRVKIADFGLAKLLGRTPIDVTLTASHQVMGTLHYMAPEQIQKPLSVDHRADIYSLGVVFYELLTGELPIGRFKLPSERAKVDARLDNVVLKTLELEPEARYQFASDVKTDVESISDSMPHRGERRRRPSAVHRPSTEEAEDAAQQLVVPGIGMVALGIVSIVLPFVVTFFIMLALGVRLIRNDDSLFTFWFLLPGVPAGIFMLLAGLSIRRLQSYEIAFIGCIAAMIPLGPLWLVSLPFGVLTLLILKKDQVRQAFAGHSDAQVSRDHARRADVNAVSNTEIKDVSAEVKAPAWSLIVLGALNLGLAVIMFIGGLLVGFFEDDDAFVCVFLSLPMYPIGILMLIGALNMRKLTSYRMAFIGAVAALVPLSPWWFFSLPVGVWALLVLRKPRVSKAFGLPRSDTSEFDVPAEKLVAASVRPMTEHEFLRAKNKIVPPAIGLIAVGFVNLIPIILFIAGIIFMGQSYPQDDRQGEFVGPNAPREMIVLSSDTALVTWGALLLVILVPLAVLLILGGMKMRKAEIYGLAVTASIVAMLPCHLGFIIGLPIGIWALVVLLSSDVRLAFQNQPTMFDDEVL